MLRLLFTLAELLLAAGIAAILYALPISALYAIFWLLLAIFALILLRPALRLSRYVTERHRRVLRRGRLRKKTENALVAPSDLPPACLSRLLEAAGIMRPTHAKCAAILSTLLDLNCRDIIEIRADGESEAVLSIPELASDAPLDSFEKPLLRLLRASMRPARSVRIRFFVEYAAHHCGMMQYRTDRFLAGVDRYLYENGYLETVYLKREGGLLKLFPKRRCAMTKKAMTETEKWCTYLGALCGHPESTAYPERILDFEKDLQRALICGVAGGIYGVARENLLREFLFAPQMIWNENQFLYRVAYDDDTIARLLWNVFRSILCYGTSHYHADDWEEDLEEARDDGEI